MLVPKAAWPIVPLTARLAADHIDARHRDKLLDLLEKAKDECFVDPRSKAGRLPGGAAARRAAVVKSKEAASWDGGDKLLSKAVIQARHATGNASVAARKRVCGDPRTLYGKSGGILGLAKLAHFLMDVAGFEIERSSAGCPPRCHHPLLTSPGSRQIVAGVDG